MMAKNAQHEEKPKSLLVQIKAAEQQVINRQRVIGYTTAILTRKLQRQMTTPTSLILASGIGFLLGEITKGRSTKPHGAANKTTPVEPSPLSVALKLVTSIQTLYTALPIVWIMKTFYQPITSQQSPKQDFTK
jgi:hypothetical protein